MRFVPSFPQKGKGRKGKEKPLQGSEQISEALQSKMAPPPGFASINMPPAGKQSSVQSSSKKPKQQKKEKQPNDAAPAEVKPVFSKDGAQSESEHNLAETKSGMQPNILETTAQNLIQNWHLILSYMVCFSEACSN